MNKNYEQLKAHSKKIETLNSIQALLGWDQETFMPQGAEEFRSEQLMTLAGMIHAEQTSPQFKAELEKLIDLKTGKIFESGLDERQQAALREWLRAYKIEVALPKEFVESFAQLCSQSMMLWKSAKEKNDFSIFAPALTKIIEAVKKKAEYLGYEEHPYDALLDLYEPGAKTSEIKKLFGNLKTKIRELLQKITQQPQPDDSFLFGNFDSTKQLEFGKTLLNAIGFDFHYGRLDQSAHPFSSSPHPTDNRITTRIHPTSLMSNLSAILHEGGHALYEAGLPAEEFGTPLAKAISLGIHESQSRWWETRIGQSLPFWKHFYPELQKTFGGSIQKISLDQFYKAFNKVEPSYIRIEADEVTYPLHVILRFELELELIEGTLKVEDLPKAWNAKMTELLGITPKTNAEGCLQDIHWSMGSFGYFPTYTLGNIYAAQLFEQFEKEFPDWTSQVEQGKLLFIREWLKNNIHRYGMQYRGRDLLRKITGREVTEAPYLHYLEAKYLS